MLLALVAATYQGYTAVLLHEFNDDRDGFGRSYTAVTALLEDNTVAGYHCEVTGVHGETSLAKPFVIEKGKLIWLATQEKYGHVYAGARGQLVGQVSIGHREYPARWTPGERGWAEAKMERLSKESGWASAISPSGAVWMCVGDSITLLGSKTKYKLERFQVQDADAAGRLYGNRFSGYGEGMRPTNTRPAIFDRGDWIELPPSRGVAVLLRVNARGIAVGTIGNQAVKWENRRLLQLGDETLTWSSPRGINDAGDVVGSYRMKRDIRACLWTGGRLIDLSKSAPDKLTGAEAINNRGGIVAKAELQNGHRLYLQSKR